VVPNEQHHALLEQGAGSFSGLAPQKDAPLRETTGQGGYADSICRKATSRSP